MNSVLSISERLLYSTIKIEATHQGQQISSGTGFYSIFGQQQKLFIPVIITNKHVVEKADEIHFKFHIADNEYKKPSGELVDVSISLKETLVNHPDDDIDLCAISFSYILSQAEEQGIKLFYAPLTSNLIPDEEDWQYFDAIEQVTMVGCPNGLFDSVNNLPLIRQGITATSVGKPYNGKQEFLIDMACFPGSSGSPVLLYNKEGCFDRKTQSLVGGEMRLRLLGILYAGPQILNSGNIILNAQPQFQIASMMHLGNVIKSTELKKLESHLIETKL